MCWHRSLHHGHVVNQVFSGMKNSVLAGVVLAILAAWSAFIYSTGKTAGQFSAQGQVSKLHKELESEQDKSRLLAAAITAQNHQVELAKAKADAADVARQQAVKHAQDLAGFSESRMRKLEATFKSATSCDDVLQQYWELRQ